MLSGKYNCYLNFKTRRAGFFFFFFNFKQKPIMLIRLSMASLVEGKGESQI